MIIIESVISKSSRLFLLHLSLWFFGSYFFNVATGESDQKNIPLNFCSNDEFQCKNGQCIAQSFICDGLLDCDDNSDETYHLCRNTSCGEQYFQCNYGACISKEYRCDGQHQCIDGSDERTEDCDDLRGHKISKREFSNLCAVPTNTLLDKSISYYNCEPNCDPKNGYVPNMTLAVVSCKPTFHPEEDASLLSNCFGGSWTPKLANCYRRCDKLNPVNVNLRCFRNGKKISCDENPLIAGTKVRPTCLPLHRYDDVAPDYTEITCNENGKWDKHPFRCVPECGRSYVDSTPSRCAYPMQRMGAAVEENYGDSPWHVAIYNSRRILICGGTIIHPLMVISAAHCFDENNTITDNPKNYEVVVSKFTRDYNVIDNSCQKIHQIKEIRVNPLKGYFGAFNYFSSDIVALVLEERITISPSVLPVCVDWISLSLKTKLAENTLGKVSGWGMNGTQWEPFSTLSERLRTANLTFISRDRCMRMVPDDFRDYVTFDKFCAGKEGGPRVLQGDSGGGFLIPQTNNYKQSYYLRGIVGLKRADLTPIAAFTDLADHYEWIFAIRKELDKVMLSTTKIVRAGLSGEEICNLYNASSCVLVQNCFAAGAYILSKTAIYCGHDDDNPEEEKICCKMQAMIGCETNITNVYWYNVGTLISDQFILSVPFSGCADGMTKWVRLGGLIEAQIDNRTESRVFEIEKSYVHPDYSFPRANIVLYKLKTIVTFNTCIRPACLFTSNLDLAKNTLRVIGWGGYEILGSKTQELHKGSLTVLDDHVCSSVNDHDPESMACAGRAADGEGLCVAGKGSPLQILKQTSSCMWRIYGIVNGYTKLPASCENFKNAGPMHFTKISYYVDWIRSIVWP